MAVAAMLGGLSGALSGATIIIVCFVVMGVAKFTAGLLLRRPVWCVVGDYGGDAAVAAMYAEQQQVIWLSGDGGAC